MSDIDFVRDGRIGDTVWDARYGNGNIVHLDGNLHTNNRVTVVFSMGNRRETFTESGAWMCGVLPSLCWDHHAIIDQGLPPERRKKRQWVPRWKPTKPTWCWCGGTEENTEQLKLVAYVNKDSGYYHTYDNIEYKYAEPCNEELIPECWPKEWR